MVNSLNMGRCWLAVCFPLGMSNKKGREAGMAALQWVWGPVREEKSVTIIQGSLSECRHGPLEL